MSKIKKPSIRIKFRSHDLRVLEIDGFKGDVLPDHSIDIPAILFIKEGEVKYMDHQETSRLKKDEYKLIPSGVMHHLSFDDHAILELITMSESKMEFK